MTIGDIKDLDRLFKLCRKHGIEEMDFQGIKFKLGPEPIKSKDVNQDEVDTDNPYSNFPDRVLTEEELAFYSAGGLPEDKGAPQ